MPVEPGEDVSIPPLTTQHPERARLEFLGQAYTLENQGLQLRRKNAVHCTLRVPRQPGKYPYKWTDGDQILTGHLRVVHGASRPRKAPVVPDLPARRYRGPGSGVR